MLDKKTLITNFFINEKIRLYSPSPYEWGSHFFKGVDTKDILESKKGDSIFPLKGDLKAERKYYNITKPIITHFLSTLKRSNYNARVFTGEGESDYELNQSNVFEIVNEINMIIRDIDNVNLLIDYKKYYIQAVDSGQRGLGTKPEDFKLKEL